MLQKNHFDFHVSSNTMWIFLWCEIQCRMPLAGLSSMQTQSVQIYSNKIVLQAAPQPVCQGTHTGKAPPMLRLPSDVNHVNHVSKVKQN